jgi:hypothetical protein
MAYLFGSPKSGLPVTETGYLHPFPRPRFGQPFRPTECVGPAVGFCENDACQVSRTDCSEADSCCPNADAKLKDRVRCALLRESADLAIGHFAAKPVPSALSC